MSTHRLFDLLEQRSLVAKAALALLLLTSSASAAGALESLYLVRHAEKQKPWPDALTTYQPLSDTGRARAEHWAEHFESLGIEAIYSSPVSRTVQTAVAISTRLDLPLTTDEATIQKDQIGDFIDRLKAQHANDRAVLVVAHSNTLPYFLRHFGADAACEELLTLHQSGNYELIEGYAGLFRVDLSQSGCQALSRQDVALPDAPPSDAPPSDALPSDASSAVEPRPVALDASQLTPSTRRYRIAYSRESMGIASVQLLPGDEQLEVRQTIDIGRAGIRQETSVILSADGSAHRKLHIEGPMGPSAADIEIQFEDGRAIGHSDFPRSKKKPQGKLPVDRPVPAGTFERHALLTLLPAMAIDRVSAFSLYAYDGREDLLQSIDVRVTGPQPMQRFDNLEAYRVEITGTEPGYVVWIHPDTPRHVIAIDWIDQPWTYELVPEKP